MKNLEINLSASLISAIMCQNKFMKPYQLFLSVWRQAEGQECEKKVLQLATESQDPKTIYTFSSLDPETRLEKYKIDICKNQSMTNFNLYKKGDDILAKNQQIINKQDPTVQNEIKKDIYSMVSMLHGIEYEDDVLDVLKKRLNIYPESIETQKRTQQKLFSTISEIGNIHWKLQGKFDAKCQMVANDTKEKIDTIIEIKNRTQKLHESPQQQDNIQLHVYMMLFKVIKGVLAQSLQRNGQINYFIIDFDRTTCITIIQRIYQFTKAFSLFMTDNYLKRILVTNKRQFNAWYKKQLLTIERRCIVDGKDITEDLVKAFIPAIE